AFGANMNADHLKRWGISPKTSTKACLKDFRLSIDLPCEYIGKGFASVVPDVGSEVWGVLHQINRLELSILDILEWIPFSYHHRLRADIVSGNEVIVAYYYVARFPEQN